MQATKAIEALTVYNKPFFVNELLAAIHPDRISPKLFEGMVHEAGVYDLSTILTAMIRQIDVSGMTSYFAGRTEDPQYVLEVLADLGHRQLKEIYLLDPELQLEIFDTLSGNDSTTLRALLILDESHREVIQELHEASQQANLAATIQSADEHALRDLYMRPEKLAALPFDRIIRYEVRSPLYQKEPRICYPLRVIGGYVVEVWQYFFMPNVWDIHLPAPDEALKVGGVLDRITPNVYKRGSINAIKLEPHTPVGYMGLLGKVGGALPRLIARQVRRNKQAHDQAMREEEIASLLNELFPT